ncbi:hypothetical protein BDZ89DRAFT_977686 [Hymenopellis radicata]|nr:hypothetical protein BDZ89DRAFT_977686 [Hymenopellis radicata]
MAPRTKTSTTRLPSSLLEEINGLPEGGNRSTRRKGKPVLSRKDARKQDRDQRKQRKAQFFAGTKRLVDDEHEEAPKPKKVKLDLPKPTPAATTKVPSNDQRKAKKPSALEKLASGSRLPPTQRETDDDRYIAYLESKLGYGKGKKIADDEDGLGDLLEFTSTIGVPTMEDIDAENLDESEEEDEDEDELELEDFYTSSEEEDAEDEWTGIPTNDNSESDSENVETSEDASAKTTTYVPPHLRNKDTTEDSEEQVKLRRNLKGLLNRMSEQNLASILDSVEELYRKHRRNDVTSTITSLIIDGISAHSLLLDSYVVLHAAFIASLHKILGLEFAANFVQNVVSSYETHYAALEDESAPTGDDPKGKECSNLVVLLAELYNFQVISCILVFDIVRGLLNDELTEFNVELLLKFMRTSGQQLRSDDPSALKDITQLVQDKVAASTEKSSSRTQFMIETLMNLKNHKAKKTATQNQSGEAVERMKKFLASLGKKRHVAANEPLRISLDDLHSAETKGKWWLVGAAWGGDPLVDRQKDAQSFASKKEDEVSTSNTLLKLAKKQGMNTDIRRSIFVVLMSSDDYVDACDRLSQLNLTEVQQREIIRVLLHCCGNEKTYNPYYTLVCQHLCKTSHSYKITLQFCLWDFLRDLGETEVGGAEVIKSMKENGGESFDLKSISSSRLRNVARAYAWWLAKDCVALTILKPVDFTTLQTQTKTFLSEMFTQLFISSQVSTPLLRTTDDNDLMMNKNRKAVEEIFIKATRVQILAMGLVYFISSLFTTENSKFTKWATEVAKDTLRTGADIIPGL